jgi:acetyl esterase/lipase
VAAVSGCGATPTSATDSYGRIAYGHEHPDQFGVLGMPRGTARALVVLLHGGYWSAEYGAGLMDPMATDLQRHGLATWNVEYRRVGDGGGWPATLTDVALALDHTAALPGVGTLPVIVVGHSAGGQLAVWAASRTRRTTGGTPRPHAVATYSLSGVLDLGTAAAEDLGGGATQALLGGTPAEVPARYADADPIRLVPARSEVVAVHAAADEIVPRSQSTAYVAADRRAGGTADLVLVPGGHFDLIDPSSAAWAAIRARLLAGSGAR